jgi:hypothetical protein
MNLGQGKRRISIHQPLSPYTFPSVVLNSLLATLLSGMLVRSNKYVITFATDR